MAKKHNFWPISSQRELCQVDSFEKVNFYHKIFLLQWLETKSPKGLLDCDFANLGFFFFKSCKILIYLLLCFFKSIYFCIHIIQNSSKKISLCRNFEFSQKFFVKSQIFLHIYLIPIMYEPWKLKKVTGNKFLFKIILEWCVIAVFRICCDYSWSNRNRHIFVISFICVYSLMCFLKQ